MSVGESKNESEIMPESQDEQCVNVNKSNETENENGLCSRIAD